MKIEIVSNPKQGTEIAKRILYKNVDKKTALFLSGGTTPKPLYSLLASEKKIRPGAVALVDERYGLPFHKDSNERMIEGTGLISYLSQQKIPFYRIFNQYRHSGNQASPEHPESLYNILTSADVRDSGQARMMLEKVAEEYDNTLRSLFKKFKKRVAIMGIGEDGHTASLRAGSQKSKVKSQKYVEGIRDFPGEFRQRITLTFKALSEMDLLIVLVFGSSKKNALKLMFTHGSDEEIPARFFNLPDISRKTIVITDQKV